MRSTRSVAVLFCVYGETMFIDFEMPGCCRGRVDSALF